MESRSKLVIRSSPQLSPANFHVSLSKAMIDADPVVPGTDDPAETLESFEVSTSQDGPSEAESSQESSSMNDSSRDKTTSDDSETICKKHKHDSDCEKNKCLRKTENSSDEDASDKPNQGKKQKKLKTSTENSDADAFSAGESSTKNSKDESSEMAKTTTSDDESGWSLSEDAMLRGMREDPRGPSWAEMTKTMKRSKKELQNRWKVIKDQSAPDADDGNSEDGTAQKSNDEKAKAKKGDTEDQGKKQKAKKQKAKNEDKDTKWHDAPHNANIISENKLAKSRAASKNTSDEILSGEEPSPDVSTTSSSIAGGYISEKVYDPENKERRRQTRYLRTHIQRALYPPSIAPEPDTYFSKEDCDTLAAVDSRYKKARWLEMQANFYNVTGRMVPLDIIREKCERAEEMEKKTRERESGRGGKDKIEKWAKGVDQENLDDPDF